MGKSIPFDMALSDQLKLTMNMISNGQPESLNAVRALEACVYGYIGANKKYLANSKAESESYETKLNELLLRKKNGNISDIEYSSEKRPLDLIFATTMFKYLSEAMRENGVHPAGDGGILTDDSIGEFDDS